MTIYEKEKENSYLIAEDEDILSFTKREQEELLEVRKYLEFKIYKIITDCMETMDYKQAFMDEEMDDMMESIIDSVNLKFKLKG